MSVKFGNLTVHISFSFAVFLAVVANIAGGESLFLSFLFSFLHEAIHLIFLYFSGIKAAEIRFFPAGIRICCDGMNLLSYRKTVFIALSAPVFNIMSGAAFFFLYKFGGNNTLYLCCVINFLLGTVNLVPLSFLDGGRAIEAILSVRAENEKVKRIMNFLSIWSLAFLFFLFFVGFIAGKTQFFLLFFCIYCFVGTFASKSK